MNTILITGSRDYNRLPLVESFLYSWINNPGGVKVDMLYVGDARGVDRTATDAWLKYTGTLPRVFRADWKAHGKAAGPIRNKEMVDSLPPGSAVFGFWDGKSNGTKQCMNYAREKGFAVFEVMGYKNLEGSKGDLVLKPWN